MKRLLVRRPALADAAVRPRFRGVLEELEPRLLFSADAAALLDPALLTGPSTETAIQQFLPPPTAMGTQAGQATDSATAATPRVELVFVDARVPDAQALVRLIEQQSNAPGRVLEIHWLSSDSDGVDQISQVLAGREDISAVHLISHGSDGSLTLGDQTLDTQTLTARAAELSRWGTALGSEADILLYGCDVAASEVGVQFLHDLALLTGADVAASADATGHQSLGGDWILEWQIGQIDTGTVLSSNLAESWVHILPTLTLRDGLNGYTGTTDTFLDQLSPSANNSTSTTVSAGRATTQNAFQTLIKFEDLIGTGANQLPPGSIINSVTLTVYMTASPTFTNPTFSLYRMSASWTDTSTYSSMGSGIDGSEYAFIADQTITDSGVKSYTFASNARMIASVQAWMNNPSSNQGWYLFCDDNSSKASFASAENGTVANRPTLTIDYTAPAPPTLDLDANNSSGAAGTGYNGAFVENGAAVKIADTDATITAGSSSTLSSMTVTIGNLLNGTAESLDATTTGSITKSYNSATGVLTLSGTDTLANYQTVLRSVTYNNSSDTPDTTARTINVVLTDPYAQTVSASSTLTVTATNDAPVITSNGGGASANLSVAETLTAVTTVTSTDPEGTARSYSIVVGGDGAKFTINSSTGVLSFISAPDYEAPTDSNTDNVYVVTVQASDGSLSDTQTLNVTVTDVLSTLIVTTVADTNDTGLGSSFTAEQLNASKGSDGKVSLREAIIAANTTAGTDTINFAITGTAGTYGEYTIATSSALPTITQAVIINGASQTGYSNRPLVVLDGAGGGAYGLELSNTSDGSTIRGLLIRDFSSYGIYIPTGSDNQTIVGNFIGSFNADGSNAGVGKGNSVAGIYTRGANTLIGGTTAADRNVISGNGSYNLYLTTDADGTIIRGNYIGTNSAGSAVFSTTNPDYGIMVETSASNITIGGTAAGAGNVISGHLREGVWVTTTGSVTLQGNYIGTDATGTVDLGNARYGIYLDDTGSATIGGTTASAGNVISGNNLGGIYASNGSIVLQGNTIGLNAAGTAALGNTGSGIELRTSNASTLGGNTAAARNIISGNSGHGIQVETSKAHTIKGNYIGTGANGSTLLGNGGAGIYINASDIIVGGKTAGDGNLIAGNTGAGIAVASGTGNLFYRNSIHSNGGLGIDVNNDGVTLNDYNDGDGGPNYRNNFPVITSVVTNGSSTTITGSIEGPTAALPVYIELFSSPSADGSGHGEGRTYLGYVQVTTDASTGDASFSTTLTGVSVGDWITAVANVEGTYIGASEFTLAVQAVSPANAPRGRLIWNNNDRFFQYYADWSSAGFGGTGSNGLSYGDDISMILAAEAPTRNEILFIGSADVAGKILAGIWNGSSWSSVIAIPIADPGADAADQNSFAVAYDNATGKAMLVWDNGGTGTTGLSYAVWDGSSWSAINTIAAPVSGEPLHMKLVSHPSSNEMVLAVQTDTGSNSSYAMVWNGSSWGNAQILGANSSNQFFELNVAYEQRSGRAMVLYDASASDSASVQYRLWNGSSWSTEGTVTAPVGITASSELYSTSIAADPTSNRIALAAKNAANEVWLGVWDGSAWGHTLAATTSGVGLTDHHATMAVAFESQSGDLLAAYGKAAGPDVAYRSWTSAGGWSAEMAGPSMGGTDVPYIVKLFSDPYSDTIMLGVQDNASDLHTAVWTGSAWGGVTTLDADTGFTYRENFSYVWYHSAPFISNLGGDTLAYQEGQGAVVIDQGSAASVVTGADSGYSGGNLTVSFVSGSTVGEDVLSVRHQGSGAGQIGVSGATVSYEGTVIGTVSGGTAGASLVVLLNANATDAAVSALTRNITYQNTNTAAPSTTSRTVRFSATNGLAQTGISRDVTITVEAINDAPVHTVPGAQSVNEDGTLVFSSSNGNLISIADVDAASGNLQVTLSVTNGVLSLSGTSGLSFSSGDGTGDATMTFTGTVSAINTALAGLSYTPTAQYNGGATLTLITSDLGNTGSGGTLTDSDTVAITVNAVNDAPVNTVPGAQSVNEDTALVFSSGNGNLISIADVDAASGNLQVTLSVTNGVLSLSGTSGLSFSSGDGTGDATMTFTGTVSAINTALAGLIYTPTAQYNGGATLTLITSDLGNTGSGGTLTDSDTVAITVNAVNDAPLNSVPGAQSVNEDGTLVFSSGNGNLISISDVDAASGNLQVTLSVTNGVLSLSGTSGLSFSSGDGTGDATMTFTGTASAINTALAGLIYTPTAQYNGGATLTLLTSDLGNTGSGGTLTDSDTVAITVNAVNDAPVNTVPGAQSVNEDTALVFSSGNGNLISIADVDNGTMQLTLSVTNGVLSLSGTSGLTFSVGDGTGDATMTFTGTVSAINTALAGLVYTPTAHFNGSATLTLLTSDLGNTGSGGVLTDSDTVAITVNAVNDAPVNSVPGAQTVNEDTNKVFSVANGNLISISDVDAGSSTMRVTIAATLGRTTLSTTAGLTFTAGDGTLDATMTFSGTASAINTALAGLIYRGNSNVSGAGSITITTSDLGNTGSGGALTDVDVIAVTINAVNDAPVNTKPGAQTVAEDTALVFSTANGNRISIADVDASTSAMQVTLSVTNGSLSLSGTTGLTFSVGDGSGDTTMTFTGTLTNINNSLAALSFTPTGDFNGASTLTIVTSDQGNTGSGGARSDTDTVAITVTAVNDAPVATITPPTYSATEQIALSLQGTGLSISDVDAASGAVRATVSVGSGTLTIAAGSTGVIVTGSGSNSVTLDGTLAQINALLAGTGGATISYVIASDTPPASDTLTLLVSDLGNTGSGGVLTASDTAVINITAVNDGPSVSITAPLYTVIENLSVSLHGSGLSVSDPDGGGIAAQVTLSVDLGTLTVLAGSTGVGVAGSGSGNVTLTGTLDQINALLSGSGAATISYTNDSGTPLADATLTLGINDLGNTGSGGALTASDSVIIDVIPPASMGSVLVPGISQGAVGGFYGFDATADLGRDDSGGGHDITLTGGVTQTAAADGRQSALLLPGGAEGGDIVGLQTGGPTTLATWVRFDATGTGDRVIDLGQASGAGIGNLVIARDGSSDRISFIIDVGGSQYTVSSAAGAITNGQWMHVAGTVDGTGLMTLYVNGVVAGSAQGVVLASGVRDHNYVGLSNTPGADALQGAVNDLLILNQALTASQIAALAQAAGPSVQEQAANGTVVGTVLSSSSNVGANISYTLSNSAGGRFTIDASTGVITVANGVALQHDESSSHIITVRSTDASDGSALDVDYTITLININDAPQGADNTVTLAEDGQHVFALADFGFGDVNDSVANQLLAVKISSLPLAGSLTLDGVAVNAGDTVLASDIALGKLVFSPAANADGTAYASIGFQVQDDGGTALGGVDLDPTVRTLTLNVSAVNDAPQGSNTTVQGTEDTPYVVTLGDFGFSDLEGHAFVSVTISSLPLDGTLTLDGVAVNAGDTILVSDIALGKLVFTPAAQAHGTGYAQIGFQVHDDGGTALGGVDMDATVRTLTLDISPVNDAPVGADGALTVDEDSDHVLQASDFGFSDPDDGGAHQLQGVRFNVLPDAGTLTLNGVAVTVDQVISVADINAGLLRYRALPDDNGPGYTSIGFHVQDDGGTALGGVNEDAQLRTLTIHVTPVNDAPVSNDASASGAEDTTIAGVVTGSDIDGDALSFTLGSGPTRGSVVVALDGSFVYTPDADVHGSDSFTVIVSDGQGGSAISTVSITVTPANDAPVSSNTSASGAEDTAIAGVVTGSDIDGDPLGYALGSGPARGSVVVASDGSFVYTPDADVNGSDSFTVIVSDGQGGSAISTVSITITPVNDQPVTSDASVSDIEDSPIAGVISGSDIDGDALSFTLGSGPTQGHVVVAADGSFVYTPHADVNGSDSFTVIVSDGQGGSTTSTVSVSITPVNDQPLTQDVSATGAEDTTIAGVVSGSDVDGDALSFTLGSGPTHGSVVVASDGSFVYTPAADVNGSDSFTVIVSDGQGGSATSTVSITLTPVNDQPVTGGTSASGAEDTVITGVVAGSDIDGDTLSFTLGNEPTLGSVVVAADGSYVYTPYADAVGSDSFTVIVSDGQGGSATSTVSITLNPVNDAPVSSDASATGAEDTAIAGTVTASDIDGDTLSFSLGSGPTRGSVVVASDGSFVYTPDADVHGSDSFTVIVSDGQGGSATSTVSITVTPVNDAPVSSNTSATGAEDTAIAGTVTASDVDGNALSFTLGSGPTRGSVVVASDGSFVYTPDADVHGSDSFTVIVSDGQGGSATSTVSITVTPVNDAPVSSNTSATGAEDTAIAGTVTASDIDGDTLSFTLGSGPTRGSVVVASDGSFVYTPDADVHGSDSFTVIVSDGQGGSATSTVSITVTPVNDAPVSSNTSATGVEDTAIAGTVTASDVDGDALSFSLGSGPTHGSVVVASDGSFVYTPHADAHGSDSFTVIVSDAQGGSATSTVSLNLTPVNDAPSSSDLNLSVTQDQPLLGAVSGTDVDGDPLGFSLGTAPLHGSVSLGANGAFTYTPTAQFTGSDSFTVLLSDGQGGSALSTVSITVLPRPVMPPMGPPVTVDPPVAPGTPIDMSPPGAGDGSNGSSPDGTVTEPTPEEQPPKEGPNEGASDGTGGQGQDAVAVLPNRPGPGGANGQSAGGPDARALGRVLLSWGQSWFTLNQEGIAVPTFNLTLVEMSTVPSGISLMPAAPLSTGDIAFSLQGSRQSDSGPSMPWGLDKVSAEQLQVSGTVLSIGAVWWISRGATLISSLLLTTPVWRQIDPLPVFSQGRTRFDDEEPPPPDGDAGDSGSEADKNLHARAEGLFDRREANQPHSIG